MHPVPVPQSIREGRHYSSHVPLSLGVYFDFLLRVLGRAPRKADFPVSTQSILLLMASIDFALLELLSLLIVHPYRGPSYLRRDY